MLLQNNGESYPTLRRIALDYLACQALSVPCEQCFSAGGEIATKRQSQLGALRLEKLVMMKSSWKNNIGDLATWNSVKVEEVEEEVGDGMMEYEDMLTADLDHEEWFNPVADKVIVVV